MGHIKWKTLPISRMLGQVDELLTLAEPTLKEAQDLARASLADQAKSVPQYMEWSLKSVADEIEYAIHKCRQAVDRCRRDLPADALAREKTLEEQGQQSIHLEV